MASSLEIRVLGELEVRHDGERLALPQSRKTRALLAYLALARRAHRRDRLSTLFWDVADDARAALRWSLTKLRPVVNAGGMARLEATRTHVELLAASVEVDGMRVREALRGGVEVMTTEALIELAGCFRGELLEGMFLPDFDEFEAWLEAERAEARGLRVRVLRELVQRLAATPEAAMPYARAWVQATSGAEPEARQSVDELAARLGDAPRSATAAAVQIAASSTSLRRAAIPFVVRRPELARLRAAAAAARECAGPHLVVVHGAPGFGKTRLLTELAQLESAAACILYGECHEAERSRSFGPLIDALRGLDPDLAPSDGGELLAALRSPSAMGISDADALFGGVAALIRGVAERCGGCLLVIDDAHLIDESSAELLHYVMRAIAGAPVLAVLACRTPDLLANEPLQRCLRGLERRLVSAELALEPLEGDEVRRLLQEAAPEVDVEPIVARSAGIPFFALELARSRANQIPPSLSEAIRTRLETLEPQAQALVRWAAVLGRAQLAQLEAVSASEVSDFVSAAEEADRYGFIHVLPDAHGTRVEMAHDLLRQVIEESLSTVRRAAMHRAVAAYLSELPAHADLAPVIAHHAVLADNPSLAVRACVAAAERSAAWQGAREAEDLVHLGLRHAEQLAAPERQERQIELLQILVRVRRPSQVDELVARLMTLGTEAMELGSGHAGQLAFHLVGYLRWDHDDPWRAHQGVLQAMQVSRANAADRALGLASSAMCLALLEQDLPRAGALLVEAELHARELVQPPVEIAVARGLLCAHRGELGAGREAFAEARAVARAVGDRPSEARALEHEMMLELQAGRLAEARALALALEELAPRIREGGEGPLARGMLALVDSAPGALRGAIEPAIAELRRLDDKRRLAILLGRLARRELAAGNLSEARLHAEEAWRLAQRMQRPSEAAVAAALLMRVASAESDAASYAEAEERLTELEATQTLSAEARAQIELATATHPTTRGDEPWSS